MLAATRLNELSNELTRPVGDFEMRHVACITDNLKSDIWDCFKWTKARRTHFVVLPSIGERGRADLRQPVDCRPSGIASGHVERRRAPKSGENRTILY